MASSQRCFEPRFKTATEKTVEVREEQGRTWRPHDGTSGVPETGKK